MIVFERVKDSEAEKRGGLGDHSILVPGLFPFSLVPPAMLWNAGMGPKIPFGCRASSVLELLWASA